MNSDQPVQIIPSYVKDRRNDDEINLIDIACALLRRKKLIFGITVTVVVIGLFYIFSMKRVYQVETTIYPPTNESVVSLNELYFVLSDKDKDKDKEPISKDTMILSFIDTINLLSFNSDIYQGVISKLTITTSKNNNNISKIYISSQSIERDKLKSWLDRLVEKANRKTANQLADSLLLDISLEIIRLKIQITNKQLKYKRLREDEIIRLQADYQIAKKLGITEHLFLPDLNKRSNEIILEEIGNIKRLISNPVNLAGYLKGTKIIQAEITSLKNRVLDDPYISDIRDLQAQLQKLEKINIDKNKLNAVFVNKKAVLSIEPISPSNNIIILIISLSLVFGVFLSFLIVYFIDFFNKLNVRLDNENKRCDN